MKNLQSIIFCGVFSVLMYTFASIGLVDWPWQKPTDSLEVLQTQSKANIQKTSAEIIALAVLKKAVGIESERTGVGARTSENFKMFQVLDASEQSKPLFLELLHSSNPVAQSYGLIGLHDNDYLLYQQYLPAFLNSHVSINVKNGCMSDIKGLADFKFHAYANSFNEVSASRD